MLRGYQSWLPRLVTGFQRAYLLETNLETGNQVRGSHAGVATSARTRGKGVFHDVRLLNY